MRQTWTGIKVIVLESNSYTLENTKFTLNSDLVIEGNPNQSLIQIEGNNTSIVIKGSFMIRNVVIDGKINLKEGCTGEYCSFC